MFQTLFSHTLRSNRQKLTSASHSPKAHLEKLARRANPPSLQIVIISLIY
jgi:hypothetical protein